MKKVSIVYVWTAICKMDSSWLNGITLSTVPSPYFKYLLKTVANTSGIDIDIFWKIFSIGTIFLELLLAAAILVIVNLKDN